MDLGSTQPLTEMSTKNTSRGIKVVCGKGRMSIVGNLVASLSWNHWSMSRSVQGLLQLYYRLVRRTENGNLTTRVVTRGS